MTAMCCESRLASVDIFFNGAVEFMVQNMLWELWEFLHRPSFDSLQFSFLRLGWGLKNFRVILGLFNLSCKIFFDVKTARLFV